MGVNDRLWANLRRWHKRMTGPEMREQLDGPPLLFGEVHHWTGEEMRTRTALMREIGPSDAVDIAEKDAGE